MRTTDQCCVCGRGPLRLSHLYGHLRRDHRWDEGQIEQKKAEYEQKRNAGKDIHKCDICSKIYHTIKNLRQHNKESHANSETESDIGCVTCPECRHKFLNNFDLAMHCSEHHRDEISGQNFRIIKGEFPSMQEFESWKESLERSETTNFAKRCSKRSKDGRRHYYVCKDARGMGAEVNAEELREAYDKSKRVHSHCPAFLKVVEQEDGTVKYEGCVGHLGHLISSATSASAPSFGVQLDGDDTSEAGLITYEGISAASTSINPEIERSDITKEAYHRFEGVDAYMHELMRSCLKKNLHEIITEVTETLTVKTKEVAEKAGMNCETTRIPVMQLSGRTSKLKPIGAYKTRGQQKVEKRQRTKAEQSQYPGAQKKRVLEAPRASSVVNCRTLKQKTYFDLAAPTYLSARHGRTEPALKD